MAKFSVMCVAFLALAAGSAHSAGIPVYQAGSFRADSDEPAVAVDNKAQEPAKVQEEEVGQLCIIEAK